MRTAYFFLFCKQTFTFCPIKCRMIMDYWALQGKAVSVSDKLNDIVKQKGTKMIKETFSDKETFELGFELGKKAVPGDIFCLDGDLGTGKTVIAKGIAAGLGVTEPVSSPTFTVIKEYREGRLPFFHFDVYRIEEPAEMDEIGYEDYFFGDGVTVIEWSDLIKELIPDKAVRIRLKKDTGKGFDYRKIEIIGET